MITHFWEEFHQFYTPIIIHMVRHFCFDLDLAEDIAQEVWVILARKVPNFNWKGNGGDLRAWIGKIVHDKAVDFLRRKSRLPLSSALEFSSEAQDRCGPDETNGRFELVKTSLEDLRPRIGELNFQIVHMHYWQDKTVPQIAAILGMSADQVYSRQKRVLQKLRRSLGRALPERISIRR